MGDLVHGERQAVTRPVPLIQNKQLKAQRLIMACYLYAVRNADDTGKL